MEFDDDELFGMFDKQKKQIAPKSTEDDTMTIGSEFGGNSKMIKDDIFELLESEDAPAFKNKTFDTNAKCIHRVVYPPYLPDSCIDIKDFEEDEKKAYEFPFELDSFQKEAILCVKNIQSVLVSAHTSAGKTAVALYTIAQALQNNQRVIYTSPIKALSNQKYRELCDSFDDVGLVTGDVTLNTTAMCLVMTTEILRSMLYRGSEIIREVGWVIFDEVHYMRDSERGVVWEESIVLLPDIVHYVFLSATIPNSQQFSEWIAMVHKQPCHMVSTEFRPVPLKHYVYPVNANNIHLIVDQHNFIESNFEAAMSSLYDDSSTAAGGRNGKSSTRNSHDCYEVVKMLISNDMGPIIVFSFSRKDCEMFAMQLMRLNLTTDDEKDLIENVFMNAVDCLSPTDKKLPHITDFLALIKKGIGIHHSGLLPIVKEAVELLFGEGLLKVLFATETFAMGLNMPARSVVFTKSIKFDGTERRYMKSSEYIQMSGRAGRRGLDDCGYVIMMCDQKIKESALKQIILSNSDPLISAFRLTYTLVLNLLRVDDINPEFVMERSFRQFQSRCSIPHLLNDLRAKKQTLTEKYSFPSGEEKILNSYYLIDKQIFDLEHSIKKIVFQPKNIFSFLTPGRLVYVKTKENDFGWAILLDYHIPQCSAQQMPRDKNGITKLLESLSIKDFRLNVLVKAQKTYSSNSNPDFGSLKPLLASDKDFTVYSLQVLGNVICKLSKIILSESSLKNLQTNDNYKQRVNLMNEAMSIISSSPSNLLLIDPIKDLKIQSHHLLNDLRKLKDLEEEIREFDLGSIDNFPDKYLKFKEKLRLIDDVDTYRKEIKDKQSLLLTNELKQHKKVLRFMKFIDEVDIVTLKGQVACEISCGDVLVLTELLFDKFFDDLTPPQIAAVLSLFVFQEKGDPLEELLPELLCPYQRVIKEVGRVASISEKAEMEIDRQVYIKSFSCGAMNSTYSWASGQQFFSIISNNNFEGSIIRAMRRILELLKEMVAASNVLGNIELGQKFTECMERIRRDIVFAASLYV